MPKLSTFVSEDDENNIAPTQNLPVSQDKLVQPINAPESVLSHLPLYLDPDFILDGDNVRPGETPEEHSIRVQSLLRQMKEDGQQQPIKIHLDPDLGPDDQPVYDQPVYRVVDGQGRVDALRMLNTQRRSNGDEPLPAWCVVSDKTDTWAEAVKLNVQRKNYTDLQLADLISQARDRYKWNTKGGGKKLAQLFGISEPHLVEYNTIASAPADIRELLLSGDLSKRAALTLMQAAPADPGKRDDIVEAATAIAEEQATRKAVKTQAQIDAKYVASRKQLDKAMKKNGAAPTTSKQAKETPKAVPEPKKGKVKVEASHIAEAARQVAEAAGEKPIVVTRRNRTEILAAIASLQDTTPENEWSTLGKSFLNGLTRFADGDFSPKQLTNRWTALLGGGN